VESGRTLFVRKPTFVRRGYGATVLRVSVREDVELQSGDDPIAAWLYRPVGADTCVVVAHGFSATRDEGLEPYAQAFAEAGLAVLVFDYRHFGASGGEPRQLLDIKRQLDDYRAAIAYARTIGRVVLWGSSFSGGHVLQLAATEKDIAAAIVQCPFADGLSTIRVGNPRNIARATAIAIADQASALAGRAPRTIPAVGPPGSFAVMTAAEAEPGFRALVQPGSAWRNEIAARVMLHVGTYRPAAKAARIECPLLVCVCDSDQTTPPGPAAKAAQRAPRGRAIHYPYGHFDIYTDPQARADQVAFLKEVLA
jgi:uncharacterized protein